MSVCNASKSFLFVASVMLAAPYALAQGGAIPAPQLAAVTKAPTYEVVSVKPSQPGCGGMSIGAPPGRFSARCITVWGLLFNAYEVQSLHDLPPGLPGWADSAVFDVEAKAGDDTVAAMQKLSGAEREEMRQRMLQALLADRFKLRVHYETRIQPIEQLVIAKSGPRLKPWPAGQDPRGRSWSSNQIAVRGGGTDQLAMCLSDELSRVVVDKTGLTGKYDIVLKWTPDNQQGTPDAGPTLVDAIQEQLGLKLEPTKGPVNALVVDHVEKPSED